MTCEEVRSKLDDWVDRTLADQDQAMVRAHLDSCGTCREEERAIRALVSAAASLPRELTPGRDLWPGISRKLDRRFRFEFGWSGLQWALVAAAVVVVAVGGLLLRERTGESRPVTATAAISSLPHARPVSTSGGATFAEAEGEFDRASAELLLFLEKHRDELPPNTVEDLKQHLAAIDTALDEIRAVLKENPGNVEATRLLASTQRRKVDVLRRVVGLSRI